MLLTKYFPLQLQTLGLKILLSIPNNFFSGLSRIQRLKLPNQVNQQNIEAGRFPSFF